MDRRSFIKLAALGLAAQPAFAQWQVTKGTWRLGETGGKALDKVSIVPAVCPYCGVSCSIDLYTDGSKIVWSRGSVESPINLGTLCSKGKAAYELVDNSMRVLYPMIRTGPKPPPEEILNAKSWEELEAVLKKYPPQWRRVSWDEAFRYIAEKLAKILDEWRAKTGAPKRADGYYYVGREVPVQVIGSSVLNIEE
ncbi:MAG: formate dehydrogenase, partial [Pyrobaculum sp.]